MMSDRDVVSVLNDLIETCLDGDYGFAKCAERVNAEPLKDLMSRRAAGCRTAAEELQRLVVDHGGRPASHGTVLGVLHRGWVTAKDVLTADSDHAVLAECERGEDVALARYRKALQHDGLPEVVRSLIARQMAGVQAHHDEVKRLRDATST